jgi:hypothetical protein
VGKPAALLAGLCDVADHHVINRTGVHAVAVDESRQQLCQKFDGMNVGQRAARLSLA